MTRRMQILLAILVVLAAALTVDRLVLAPAQTDPITRAETIAPPNDQPSALPAENAPLLAELSEYRQIWDRTLFSNTRRAEPLAIPNRNLNPAPRQSAMNSDQPPDFTVTGVAIRPGGGSVMIRKGRNDVVRALLGEEVDGWTIEAIEPEAVTFSKNQDRWQVPVGSE